MKWYDTDREYRNQNADTDLVEHGYWSLCLTDDRTAWHLALLQQNDDLSEIISEPYDGTFATEDDAKDFAETQEALPDIFWTDYGWKAEE